MPFYRVRRLDRIGYDEYDAFVCTAANAEEAAKLHPTGKQVDLDWYNWPTGMVNLLEVVEIPDSTESRVILASFNAG